MLHLSLASSRAGNGLLPSGENRGKAKRLFRPNLLASKLSTMFAEALAADKVDREDRNGLNLPVQAHTFSSGMHIKDSIEDMNSLSRLPSLPLN